MEVVDNKEIPAVKIEGISKKFHSAEAPGATKVALDDVSLSLPQGTICGLLGPNGAGKTTLLRIINNILVADSGTVSIMGKPVSLDQTSPLTGYMPEERGLYDDMRVEDQIIYFGLLKGGDKKALREVMNEYLELFNLADDKRRKIKELSKGNQQKVQIISTIVHQPNIVMLDEPFSGFDPINGALLRQLIDRLRERGTTVILSSHNMESIEKMCSRIALINHGKLLLDGNLDDIKETHRDGTLLLTTRNPLHLPLLLDTATVATITPLTPTAASSSAPAAVFGASSPAYAASAASSSSSSAASAAVFGASSPAVAAPSASTDSSPSSPAVAAPSASTDSSASEASSMASHELHTGMEIPSRRGYTYRLTATPGTTNSQLLTAVATQAEILSFNEHLPSLSDIFIRYASLP